MDIDKLFNYVISDEKEIKKEFEKFEKITTGDVKKIKIDIITGDVLYKNKYNISKIKLEEINKMEYQEKYELLDLMSKKSVIEKIENLEKLRSEIRDSINVKKAKEVLNYYVKTRKNLQKDSRIRDRLNKKGLVDDNGMIRVDALLYYKIILDRDERKKLNEFVDIFAGKINDKDCVVAGEKSDVVKYYENVFRKKIMILKEENDLVQMLDVWPQKRNVKKAKMIEDKKINIENNCFLKNEIIFEIKKILNHNNNEHLNKACDKYFEKKGLDIALKTPIIEVLKKINKMTMMPRETIIKLIETSQIEILIKKKMIEEVEIENVKINKGKGVKVKYYTVAQNGKSLLMKTGREKIKKDYKKRKQEYIHDSLVYDAYDYFLKNIKKTNEEVVDVYNDLQLKSMAQRKGALDRVIDGDKMYLPDLSIVVKNEAGVEDVYNIELAVNYMPRIIAGKQGSIKNLHWFTNSKRQGKSIMKHGKTNRVYCV